MPGIARKAAEEARTLRSLRADIGLRRALAARMRWHLELGSVPDRLRQVEDGAGARLDAAERRLGVLEERLAHHDFRATHSEDRLAEAERTLDGVARLSRMLDAILATTALVDRLPPSDTLVSVITPTYNRSTELAEAIASVEAQTHQTWELIVVDDASDATTEKLLASLDDPRVVPVRRPVNEGASAARNVGLERASGSIVVYLDDDNVMRPSWLRAVVWAFDTHPDAEVVYGARSMEFVGQTFPWVQLDAWDRNLMQTRCIIDQNVIAHRAGLPEAYLDPEIETGSDWDLAMRLTADRDPVCVPVVAVVYRTGADGRLSDARRAHSDWIDVQRRELRRSPLRILAADFGSRSLDPAHAEAEAAELRRQGAVVAWWSETGEERLDLITEALDPRVVAVFGDTITGPQIAQLERLQRPFYLRRRGTPGSLDALDRALGHPLCIGVLDAPGDDFVASELLPHLDRIRARYAGFIAPAPAAPASTR